MAVNPVLPQSRSTRLKGYDYSQAGGYFFTLTVQNRERIFGDVHDGVMRLSRYGLIVQQEWLRTAQVRHRVELDDFIVMPDHIHGIIFFTNPDVLISQTEQLRTLSRPARSLGSFIAGLKAITTIRINEMREMPGIKVWQRNYFDRIIRDEKELDRIREYIETNPVRWSDDHKL